MSGIPEIVKLIPHRSTMLLVDSIEELLPGQLVRASKVVSFGEVWYRGERPLTQTFLSYPHAILLESFNQACALLVMATWAGDGTDVLEAGIPMLGTYNNLRFGKDVQPGSVLRHEVRMISGSTDTMVLSGQSTVDGNVVLTAGHGIVIRRPADLLSDRER